MTRRYHALLIAALPAPLGRIVMVSQLGERVRLPGGRVHWLSGEERMGGALFMEGMNRLKEFRLEGGLPVWTFDIDGVVVEKRLFLPRFQNTVQVIYRYVAGSGTDSAGPAAFAYRPCPTRRLWTIRCRPARVARARRPAERSVSGRSVPAARLQSPGGTGRLHRRRRSVQHLYYRGRGEPRLPGAGDALEPRLFSRRPRAGAERDVCGVDRAWER